VGELRKDFEWRQQLQAAIREACAVATADGVPLQFSTQWAIVEDVTDDATTSAARDVAAGRASELDALVGAVLRAAERLDVPTPALRELATSAGLP
jgi:2-dehydropantoate 2-reductase